LASAEGGLLWLEDCLNTAVGGEEDADEDGNGDEESEVHHDEIVTADE
jgi:hypothetical protein